MNRQLAIVIFACFLVLMFGAASASAASFDLLLKGHWAYAELAVLADGGLLEGYRSFQQLAEVYPLTRYEAALLIGDLLAPGDQGSLPGGLSADALMWKMLENRSGDRSVKLSSEAVAQTRRASEAAYRALARLAKEFADELNALGIAHGEVEKGFFPMTTRSGTAGPGGPRGSETLGQFGAARIVGPLPAASWGKNGFSLSDGFIVETVPLTLTPFAALSEMAYSQEDPPAPSANVVELSSGGAQAPAEDIYSPIEVSALFEKLNEEERDLLPAALEPLKENAPADTEDSSLKLVANMTDGRPTGLLTSYFLSRTANQP
ncbi:MAG: hypothetical protein GX063_08130 [Firmicutes bacterium]|nr:hypothetical protein [Bacillota bacterium]